MISPGHDWFRDGWSRYMTDADVADSSMTDLIHDVLYRRIEQAIFFSSSIDYHPYHRTQRALSRSPKARFRTSPWLVHRDKILDSP